MAKTNAAAVTVVAVLLIAGASALLYAMFGVKEPPARPRQEVLADPTPAPVLPAVEPVEPGNAVDPVPPPPESARGPAWKDGGHPMFQPINALAYDEKRGMRNGNDHLAYIDRGTWVRYRDVELGDGAGMVVMAIACDQKVAGHVITLHTDAPNGPVIGTLQVTATPGTFEQMYAPINARAGRHDVFLTFTGGGYNIRSIKFTAGVRDATQTIHASSHSAAVGVKEQGTRVLGPGGGDWMRYDSLDFGAAGVDSFIVDVIYRLSWGGGAIEVRLDAVDGPIIARQVIPGGDEPRFVTGTLETPLLAPAKGIHDVYLTFTGGNEVVDINWFRFRRGPAPTPAVAPPPPPQFLPTTRPTTRPTRLQEIFSVFKRPAPTTRPAQP
jgi:hypothetical protein